MLFRSSAREIFQALLRVVPDNPQVLLLAGETEMRLGAGVQAETMFAKAATLAPNNPEARRLLARAQLRLGQPAKAITTLGPLVEKADAGAEDLALAAEARLLTGDAKAADALFVRVARLAPTDPQLRTMVAVNAMGRGNDAAAFTELNSIAAADSGTGADLDRKSVV